MTLLQTLELLNYCLVLIYGHFLTVGIAGGCATAHQRRMISLLCPVFLLAQGFCWMLFGMEKVQRLYPLIVHLPLTLVLIFVLKKPTGIAVISTCTAYLCCQLPRWIDTVCTALTHSQILGEIAYMILIFPLFFLLQRYFVRAAYDAMTCSQTAPLLFGSLPIAYYIFDYATTVYSGALYAGVRLVAEFLPTALIAFYVLFLTAYHAQLQKRTQAEMQRSLLETELRQSQQEMDALRRSEMQSALYRHDMRHHLSMIDGYLAAGQSQQASDYIRSVQSDIASVAPARFCENETINLLCAAFRRKTERAGVRLDLDVSAPAELPFGDTELCSLISNGLENALHAAEPLSGPKKWISFYCAVQRGQLLLEIKNPYAGEISMKNGLPQTDRAGHGYGCRSIQTVAEQCGGLCRFRAEHGTFLLQLALPMQSAREPAAKA